VAQTLHEAGHFDHRMRGNDPAACPVGVGKQFAFEDVATVADADELHGPSVRLMVQALGNDQSACRDALSGVMANLGNRTVSIPRNLREQFHRMAADRKA